MTRIINVASSNWHPADSYGRKARELCHWLTGQGYHVNRFGPGAPAQTIRPALGGILLGYPTLYKEFGALLNQGPRLAVTAWESTTIPDGWSAVLNQMNAVSVGSRFTADTLRQNGVGAPVHVHPLGISPAFRQTVERSHSAPFTFLAFADRHVRKGWIAAYKAFRIAFGDSPRYRLLIKSRRESPGLVGSNVTVLTGDYSESEMASLYYQAHVLLFPTMGEGFGLPPREFAASGGLSLSTNWGGTQDGLLQWGIPLPYQMGPAWVNDPQREGLGEWAYVPIDALAELIQHVATHYDDYRPFIRRAAGYVKTHYRWSHFGQQIDTLWQHITESEVNHERIV